ncbi:MAG: 1-acyl-sn-glycerol-3-phosphate acyltransferase [Acidimicrobiales bacterium]
MTTSRDRPYGRRLVTVPAVFVLLPLAVASVPVWGPVAVAVDLAQGLRRLPSLRLGAMAIVYLVHEWICLALALGLTGRDAALAVAGRRPREPVSWRRVEGWWIASLLAWARRLLAIRFDLPRPADFPAGGFVLVSRHASMADAVLPVWLLTGLQERWVHYVLKRELRFDPTLDIYGRRLGNHFISRRGADSEAEAVALTGLARRAGPGAALVIFPEGTYATPARRRRIRGSLARRGAADLVALADDLRHLLPPKPAGTLALLAGQPGFDVVVLGHVGLEGMSELRGLRRRLPLDEPVAVRWWHHRRAELPAGEAELIAWLNDRWRTLDRWIDSAGSNRPAGGGPPAVGVPPDRTGDRG